MRVLPNRRVRARDAWRAVLNTRAESRHAACCRCRECGFVAFRALEHCPVCGQWNWPFESIGHTPADARAAHAPRSFHTWSSRVARALRNAAFQRPRASSAPILSILTLVLLVGGYVMVDQTCKADPVCRGSGVPGAVATGAVLQASNEPLIPVVPAPVYPFHSTDETAVAARPPLANPPQDAPLAGKPARRMAVAQAAPSLRARLTGRAPARSASPTGKTTATPPIARVRSAASACTPGGHVAPRPATPNSRSSIAATERAIRARVPVDSIF
nr:hypothetical protein [Burkholderia cenocepacia]